MGRWLKSLKYLLRTVILLNARFRGPFKETIHIADSRQIMLLMHLKQDKLLGDVGLSKLSGQNWETIWKATYGIHACFSCILYCRLERIIVHTTIRLRDFLLLASMLAVDMSCFIMAVGLCWLHLKGPLFMRKTCACPCD